MTLSSVATRYANALADVAAAPGSPLAPREAVAQLSAFAQVLAGSQELQNALLSPAVPPGRKRAVVQRIGDDLKISRIVRNFLYVLVDHRRIGLVPQIAAKFDLLIDERMGFARAEVTSAGNLSPEQRKMVESVLSRLTGKTVRARYAVDEALIGGMTAKIGSTVYDGSVRGQLETLGKRLAAE